MASITVSAARVCGQKLLGVANNGKNGTRRRVERCCSTKESGLQGMA